MSDLQLREFLAGRDTPCPACGYNLRGLVGGACPECNQRLILQVGLAEPRLAGFLTAVIATSLGVGFSGLLMVYVLVVIARGRGGGAVIEILYYCGVPFLIQMPLLAAMLWKRRRFRRAADGAQWALALLAIVLTLANLLVFSFNIR